jgi:hypothetical protein
MEDGNWIPVAASWKRPAAPQKPKSLLLLVPLDSRSSYEVIDQRHDEQEEKDIKDNLRYSSGCDSNAAKPQDPRNNRDDEKRQNPA